MAKKTNLLKNLLTTASALAVLAGGVQTAAAGAKNPQASDPAVGSVAADWGGAALVDTDWIVYTDARSVRLDQANRIIAGISLGGQNLGPNYIQVSDDTKIGSIGGGGNAPVFKVDDNKTLKLTATQTDAGAAVAANIYTSLGAVTLGSANAGGATLVIEPAVPAPLNFGATTTIDGDQAGKGILKIENTGFTTTFGGVIGGTKHLASITVGDGAADAGIAAFNANVSAAAINIGAAQTAIANFAAAQNVKVDTMQIGGANVGEVNFSGNVTNVAATGAAVITVGDNLNAGIINLLNFEAGVSQATINYDNAVSTVTIGNNTNAKVTGSVNFLAKDAVFKMNGGGGNANRAILEGAITAGAVDTGVLDIDNFVSVTGAIGGDGLAAVNSLKLITVGKAVAANAVFGDAVKATTITVDNGSTLAIAGTTQATTINVGAANGAGNVTFGAAVTNLAGAAAAAINVGDVANTAGVVKFNLGDSIADLTFVGNNVNSSVTIGNNGAAKLTSAAGLNFGGIARTLNLHGAQVLNTAEFVGDIVDGGVGAGVLKTKGLAKVTGQIGNAAPIASITVGDGAVSTATFTDVVKANVIDVSNGQGVFNSTVNATTINVGIANNPGAADFVHNVTNLTGAGAAAVAVGGVTAAGNVTFRGVGSKANITMGNGGSIVTLAAGAKITGDIKGGIGTLVFQGAGIVDDVNVAAITFGLGGAVSMNDVTSGLTIGAGNDVSVSSAASADFAGAGTLEVRQSIGDIDFANQVGTVNVADGAIVGEVNSTAGSNGTLVFQGACGTVGQIGATNPLTLVKLAGVGTVELAAADNQATTFELNNADSIIALKDAGKITGKVTNTTLTDGKGILKFRGAGEVTGDIGAAGAALQAVIFEDAKNVKLGGDSFAKNYTYSAAATVTSNGSMEGDVNFDGSGGTLKIADGRNITGAVDNSDPKLSSGTLELEGDTTVSGLVGATTPLQLVKLSGAAGKTGTFTSKVKADELNTGANATIFQLNGGAVINKLTASNGAALVKIANTLTLEFTGLETAIRIPVSKIVFDGDDSALKFSSTDDAGVKVTINGVLNPGGVAKGIVELYAQNNAGNSNLTVTAGPLGGTGVINGANTLQEIKVTGDGQVNLESETNTVILSIDDDSKLLATNATAGTRSATIAITGTGVMDFQPTANADINFLTFTSANGELKLSSIAGGTKTFTLQKDITTGGAGFGTVTLNAVNRAASTSKVILASNGAHTIGNGLGKIVAKGTGKSTITSDVNLTNVDALDVEKGADLTIESTTAGAPNISIGTDGGTGAGAANLTIDATAGGMELLDGKTIKFMHEDSKLILKNSGNVDNHTITLKGDLSPLNSAGIPTDLIGKVEINAAGTKNLAIADQTIGDDVTHRLKELIVSGDKKATINPDIFAKTITISNTQEVVFGGAIDTGDTAGTADGLINITSAPMNGILFNANTKTKQIKTNRNAAVMTVDAGKVLQVDEIEDGVAILNLGNGSEIKSYADTYADVKVNLAKINLIQAVNDTATLAGGDYKVTEIFATEAGTGGVTLKDGFKLTGDINKTGGAAANLTFEKSGSITGSIGSNNTGANPAGVITVGDTGTLTLAGDDKFYNAASFNGVKNVGGDYTSTLALTGTGTTTINADIGAVDASFKEVIITGGDVTLAKNKKILSKELIFNNKDAIKLKTNAANVIGGAVVTARNNENLMIIQGDQNFTAAFGQSAARFGTVRIDSNHTITAGVEGFYADLITNVHGQGKVIINGNNFDGNIGNYNKDDKYYFKEVRFTADGSVNEVFSYTIIVDENKAATFKSYPSFQIMDMAAGSTANFELFSDSKGEVDKVIAKESDFVEDIKKLDFLKITGTETTVLNFYSGMIVVQDYINFGEINFSTKDTDANKGIDKRVVLTTDKLGAKKIKFDKSDIVVLQPITLDGSTEFNNATITLDTNDMSFKNGAVNFNGINTIKTKVRNNKEIGNFVVLGGSSMQINGTMDFEIDNTDGKFSGETIVVIKKNGGTTPAQFVAIRGVSDTFTNWITQIEANGDIALVSQSRIAEQLKKITEDKNVSEEIISKETKKVFTDATPDSQVYKIAKEIATQTEDNQVDAISRLSNSTNINVDQISFDTTNNVESGITARIFSMASTFAPSFTPDITPTSFNVPVNIAPSAPTISGGIGGGTTIAPAPTTGGGTTIAPAPTTGGGRTGGGTTVAPNNSGPTGGTTSPESGGGTGGENQTDNRKARKVASEEVFAGIAAGDDSARYGMWLAPIYGDSLQGTTNSAPGYRARTGGMTLGFDTKINDDTIIGGALTGVNTNAKFKGYKAGDKTKIDSILFSIYSMRQLTNNFFMQGIFTFGSTNIESKEGRRISNTETQTAKGKYSSMLFSSEVLLGYNKVVGGKFVFTPMAGFDYKHVNDASYTETGTTNQNRKITKKANDKIDFVAGLRISTAPFMIGELEVTPDIHGFIRQDLTDKKVQVEIDVDSGTNERFATDSSDPVKTAGSIGFGINAKYNMMDYGVTYDVNLGKKLVGQQGSIKLRVNF